MADLPSFRPRGALGYLQKNGVVTAAPEFLRWLDLFLRQTDRNTSAIAVDLSLSPVGVSSGSVFGTARDNAPVSALLGGGRDHDPISAEGVAAHDYSPVALCECPSEEFTPV